MQLLPYNDLKAFHTFSISVRAQYIIQADSVDDLMQIYQNPSYQVLPKIILGGGSDVFFCDDFPGVVILNRIKGKKITEDTRYFYLDVASGEDWHELVKWSIEQGINGLENLALIPGLAGSAPIQNIGAYGVEFKDVCHYVKVLNTHNGQLFELTAEECHFSYRESLFKSQYKDGYIIVGIGLKLAKKWQPQLTYGPLTCLDADQVTGQEIFDKICEVRRQKLPDPKQIGNAGSFFKNPIVTTKIAEKLQAQYVNMPAYRQKDKMKLAAGWLIDQVGLKGFTQGNAQVYPNQALVLTNKGDASPQEIIELAKLVIDAVYAKFGVRLEHEVRCFSHGQEVNLNTIFAKMEA